MYSSPSPVAAPRTAHSRDRNKASPRESLSVTEETYQVFILQHSHTGSRPAHLLAHPWELPRALDF